MDKTKIHSVIQKYAKTDEEKEELLVIVEEMIHHRIIGCVLDNLPREFHEEFLQKMSDKKMGDELIKYLEEKSGKEISDKIRKAAAELEAEILQELN